MSVSVSLYIDAVANVGKCGVREVQGHWLGRADMEEGSVLSSWSDDGVGLVRGLNPHMWRQGRH